MKNIYFLISILLTFCILGCGGYKKFERYNEYHEENNANNCSDFYILSNKSYHFDLLPEEIVSIWEDKNYEVQQDTFYKNEKWFSPYARLFGFNGPEQNIDFVYFGLHESYKGGSSIQIHGVCIEDSPYDELSIPKFNKRLKKLNASIKEEFIDVIKN